MKTKLVTLAFVLSSSITYGQFYSEDFSGQNGKGATGNSNDGLTQDTAGVSWTITVPAGITGDTSTNEWYVESEEFVGQDMGGGCSSAHVLASSLCSRVGRIDREQTQVRR